MTVNRAFGLVAAALCFGWLLLPRQLPAADGDAAVKSLMTANGCFKCHSVKHKLAGPSYQEVARHYRGKKGVVEMLVRKVRRGGSHHWGQEPMAPHPELTDAQLRQMVRWVLEQ